MRTVVTKSRRKGEAEYVGNLTIEFPKNQREVDKMVKWLLSVVDTLEYEDKTDWEKKVRFRLMR